MYTTTYTSTLLKPLRLASEDGESLSVCTFSTGRDATKVSLEGAEEREDLPAFDATRAWLGAYFAGERPSPHGLALSPAGTPFQLAVWQALLQIPYGQTVTYGWVAERVGEMRGKPTSARAVGGAVGANPICIIAPCHRVVGASGSLTGFGGGMEAKVALLAHEGVDLSRFTVPARGTAL
jgi:methylated-DNA-[protein]-cysteine S-methyltransferase